MTLNKSLPLKTNKTTHCILKANNGQIRGMQNLIKVTSHSDLSLHCAHIPFCKSLDRSFDRPI